MLGFGLGHRLEFEVGHGLGCGVGNRLKFGVGHGLGFGVIRVLIPTAMKRFLTTRKNFVLSNLKTKKNKGDICKRRIEYFGQSRFG